jgi:hypothetical protein
VIYPILNLNGTDGPTLEEWHRRVLTKFDELIEEIKNVEPHGRDYQLNNPRDYRIARADHIVRLERIEDLRRKYARLFANICEQNDARKQQQQ